MNLSLCLQLLERYNVTIQEDRTDEDGIRTIVLGAPLPSVPYGLGKFVYTTLALSPGQTELSLEEREAIKRRLHHLTTNIFGDDPDAVELIDDHEPGSHIHPIVAKR